MANIPTPASDPQQRTDVEQAKAKLQEVQEVKEARRDPRAGENLPMRRERPATDAKVAMEYEQGKGIRPVKAKPKKKKFGQKLKEALFGEDVGNGNISEAIFFKYFIPWLKRGLSDMANTAINMALGLDPKTRTIGGGNTHTANASLYRDRNYSRRDDAPSYTRRDAISEYEWDEETARDIYTQISELIDRYGECTLADAYSIMGQGDRIRTTDRNWGWTSMRNADVVPVNAMRDSWIVDMPSARPLR